MEIEYKTLRKSNKNPFKLSNYAISSTYLHLIFIRIVEGRWVMRKVGFRCDGVVLHHLSKAMHLCMGSKFYFRLQLEAFALSQERKKNLIKWWKRKWTFGGWLKIYFRLRLKAKARQFEASRDYDPSVQGFEGWFSH